MMQAAARSYRLNQTHQHCKVIYLFAENTMEHTAVQLMSRKQRAAKLLTGDIGLTGLEALTEGEGGLEEALLAAIGQDEALLDPSEMFKVARAQSELNAEDASYWNVDIAAEALVEPQTVQQIVLEEILPTEAELYFADLLATWHQTNVTPKPDVIVTKLKKATPPKSTTQPKLTRAPQSTPQQLSLF